MSNQELNGLEIPKVTKSKVITDLSLENLALREAIVKLVQQKEALEFRVAELTNKLKRSVEADYFSSHVKSMFNRGEIPIPEAILKRHAFVDVTCLPENIRFEKNGVLAGVIFSAEGYSCRLGFMFRVIPDPLSNLDEAPYYPDFHIGFTKQAPVPSKKAHRPRKKSEAKPPSTP